MDVFRGKQLLQLLQLLLLLQLQLLLLHLHTTDGVRCFSQFIVSSLSCEGPIGEVDQDICCLNPKFGYTTVDGQCHSCGLPAWSSWSEWSQCTTLCGEGVKLRSRSCYGRGQAECEKKGDKHQADWCNGTCCDGEGWYQWSSWSACSVSCGDGGVMRRNRQCTERRECALACAGALEETQACGLTTCPVHGGWSAWSDWSECSQSCISLHGNVPTKEQSRSCSSPAPSVLPPGDDCRGESLQMHQCSELPRCAVDGGWGPWSDPGPCSVSCGEGLQLSLRSCDQPPPQYGGRYCEGPSTRSSVCQSPCPVPSFWTGWSEWAECSGTCVPDGGVVPQRTRRRFCFTPSGSGTCEGPEHDSEPCPGLKYCQVHGSWGPWSAFSLCPVTCGLGLQVSNRACDSPAPKHGGQRCHGDSSRSQMCNSQQYCPVDGKWSEWSSWGPCQDLFDPDYSISCTTIGGSQRHKRLCLHKALGGASCPIGPLSESRVCYDVDGCKVKGQWTGWAPWSLCMPPCGAGSQRSRKRTCTPDYKDYSPTIGLRNEPATFFGAPRADCGSPATSESQNCVNAPPCS
ncbi:properdin-like [Eucyclogobius newberryi]|uniref:properdin-like n=1 Tax=Eucyclogobius newberryi TaxID=166745 RepID=UPI003B5BB8D4